MKSKLIYSKWKVLLVGLILVAIRFYPTVLERKVLVYGDNYSLQVPERLYTGYWLRQGVIPWWNSTVFAGIPWAHEISQTVFYPSSIFFTILDPAIALNLTIAGHLLFTFWGMYLFLLLWQKNNFASLVGAIMWTFSTQVTGSINNLVTIQSISWFPWVLYTGLLVTHKPLAFFLFGLTVLGQFLAGYPQHVIYAILLAVGLSGLKEWHKISFWRWLLYWITTGIYTLGITAVAWIPFIDPFINSTRIIQTPAQSATGSLHPGMLVKILLPYFFDNPAAGMKWGPAWSGFPNSVFYITWFGLMSVIISLKKINSRNAVLFGVIIFTLFFAMGSFLPGFTSLQRLMPFFNAGRYPSMVLVCTNILLIMLATTGLIRLQKWVIPFKLLLLIVFLFVMGLLLYLIIPTFFSFLWDWSNHLLRGRLSFSPFHTTIRDQLLVTNILLDFSITCGLFMMSLLLIRNRMVIGAVIVIGMDLIFNTQGMLLFATPSVYPTLKEIQTVTNALPSQLKDPQYRTITRNVNEPYTDFGMYWEAITVRSPFSDSFINSAELESSSHLKQIRDSLTPDWNMVYQIPVVHGYTTLLPQDYSKIWQLSSDPRINFIEHIDINNSLLSDWSVKNYMVDKQFEIKEFLPNSVPVTLSNTVDVYTLPALARFRFEDDTPVNISSLKEDPNTIELTINNNNYKSLIIADRYDKNWNANINGEVAEIINFSGMRKINLVEGHNQIIIQFIPTMFYVGLGITIIVILLTISIPHITKISIKRYGN